MQFAFFSNAFSVYFVVHLLTSIQCNELIESKKVNGRCSRPNIPPSAALRLVAPEKTQFNEGEKIYVDCERGQLPPVEQTRSCRRGSWEGGPARCGKAISDANVVHIKAFRCEDIHSAIFSYNLRLSDSASLQLLPNSYHYLRSKQSLTVFGSKCYRWILTFERAIEISFLMLDISFTKVAELNETPIVQVDVAGRDCKLRDQSYRVVDNADEVFGNYFFCDHKSASLSKDGDTLLADNLTMDVYTPSKRTVNLEAVYVGETYKRDLSLQQVNVTDCGKLEIQRIGVIEIPELTYTLVRCNDSFAEEGGEKVHKFVCDSNGLWQGSWPICVPKSTCSKAEITESLEDASLVVDQVGNVYYGNATDWAAIDYTWVRYGCANAETGIMVGRNDRLCLAGNWTNKTPFCTDPPGLPADSLTLIFIVVSVLVFLIAGFSLVVYLALKKMNHQLASAQNELQASALTQQYCSSQEYYAELQEMDGVANRELYTMPFQETPEKNRYVAAPRGVNKPETEPKNLLTFEARLGLRKSGDLPQYANHDVILGK